MRMGGVGYGAYFRGSLKLHGIGILGGFLWMIALSFNVIASGVAGPAISYALGQGATLVAALWGLLIWHEFRHARAGTGKYIALMLAGYALAGPDSDWSCVFVVTPRDLVWIRFGPREDAKPCSARWRRWVGSKRCEDLRDGRRAVELLARDPRWVDLLRLEAIRLGDCNGSFMRQSGPLNPISWMRDLPRRAFSPKRVYFRKGTCSIYTAFMRKRTAVLAISALIAITAFCPALVCSPVRDTHACCPHSQHRHTDSQTCPYVLLAKTKSVSTPVAVPPLHLAAIAFVVSMDHGGELATIPSQSHVLIRVVPPPSRSPAVIRAAIPAC